jgi:hypothetical protein
LVALSEACIQALQACKDVVQRLFGKTFTAPDPEGIEYE